MTSHVVLALVLVCCILQIALLLALLGNLARVPFRRDDPRRWRRVGLSFIAYVSFVVIVNVLLAPQAVADWKAYWIPSPGNLPTLKAGDRILVERTAYLHSAPERGDIILFNPPAIATDQRNTAWIKRVIGTPGDRIAIRDNHLYLNGAPQAEPYVGLFDPSKDKSGEVREPIGKYLYTFPDPDMMDVPAGRNAYIYVAPGSSLQDMRYRSEATSDKSPKASGDYLFFVHNDPREGLVEVVPPGKLFVMGDNRNDSEDSHYIGCVDAGRVTGRACFVFWPPSRIHELH